MFKRSTTPEDKPVGLLTGLRRQVKAHRTPLFAAAIAFFAFVALVPALVATVSIVGLVSDTDVLVEETESALENAPAETKDFLVSQIRSIAETDSAGAGAAVAIGIALALFSASSAVGNLMSALNAVFERTERRSFVTKRLTALVLLFGAIVVLTAMIGVMTVVPELLEDFTGGTVARVLIEVGRFAGLALLVVGSISMLYRFGPTPAESTTYELVPGGRRPLFTVGGLVGALLLVVSSWAFGWFARTLGSYNETYGTLAGIIVVLVWLQLIAMAVLIGAEVDAFRRAARIDAARRERGLAATSTAAES